MDYTICSVISAHLGAVSCGYAVIWVFGLFGVLSSVLSIWFFGFLRIVSALAAEDSAENVPVEQISAALETEGRNSALNKSYRTTIASQFYP